MHFRPMLIVEETNDKSLMTYLMGMGTSIPLGVYIWLVEGAGKNVLIDTGCSADYLNSIGSHRSRFPLKKRSWRRLG